MLTNPRSISNSQPLPTPLAAIGSSSARPTRRAALKLGGSGLLGLTMQPWLQAAPLPHHRPRTKSVIFLFQWGGPSHLDMFDMKPEAPDGIRSPYRCISSTVPGLPVCELLPRMAQLMHKVTLIRTMTHTMKNHASAGYYAITGHEPPSDDQRLRDSLSLYPAYGSVVDHLLPAEGSIPTFVAYPHVIRDGSIVPGQHASFLGKAHDPLFFSEDPNQPDFRLPELSLPEDLPFGRLQQRRALQQLIDRQTGLLEASLQARGFDDYYGKAISMLTTDRVRQAFDLSRENDAVRAAYGLTTYGQSCLLARRLVESGVRFVTVYFSNSIGGRRVGSGGWDTHGFDNTRMYEIVDKYHLPITDQTLPTLLNDLDQRGLLDDTLVVWMGEFGRTPKINKNESRDHWPQCYSALLAGGGVTQGQVYGTSDSYGMYPAEHPVRPEDLAATMFYLLGIDPHTEVRDRANRPLPIAPGRVLNRIIA